MILWTAKSLHKLRQALAEELAATTPDAFPQKCRELDQRLELSFPNCTVVVQDVFVGFRRKSDKWILLVEVFCPDEPQSYVVKLCSVDDMNQEMKAWNSCRPPGLRHDIVLLPPELRCDPNTKAPLSLVYGDANQFIGAATTVPFEEAALDGIHFGTPSLATVAFVVTEIFERLGQLFYAQFYVVDPLDQQDFKLDVSHLDECLWLWENNDVLRGVRQAANELTRGPGQFFDPVRHFRGIQKSVYFKDYFVKNLSGDEQQQRAETERECAERRAQVDEHRAAAIRNGRLPPLHRLVPRMIRGCAHGDLHGRNILVGVVGDRVMWPTVYDYEDMGLDNLIGWDFVKLETELKIRAYSAIMHGELPLIPSQGVAYGEEAAYLAAVNRREVELNAKTEGYRRLESWPKDPDFDTPAQRLEGLLLEIRRLAHFHLGKHRGRPDEWLEEYYFLLACYGLITARFPNLHERERLAAYVSAGVATARLSWPRETYEAERKLLDLPRRTFPEGARNE